jgi:hypothetical protein
MPSRFITAVSGTTERNNIIPGSLANPKAAGFVYDTNTQVLWVYDPNTSSYLSISVALLNALTGSATLLNALTGGTNAVPGGAGAIPTFPQIAYAQYNFATDGGATGPITPAINSTIPANAIITRCIFNPTTAVTSGGSATIAIGTTAGSSASALLAATAKASFSLDATLNGVPVPQTGATWVKLSAAGQIDITVAVAALTAGVIEMFVEYFVPQNS